MKKGYKNLLGLLLSLTLSVVTHMLPMYTSVPNYIYLNIAGTILVILLFGSGFGAIYAGLLHLVLNNIGMGMGTQYPVLASQVVQALFIGIMIRQIKGWKKIIIVPIAMGLISFPLNSFIYSAFKLNLKGAILRVIEGYSSYISNDLVSNIVKYLVSLLVAIFFIKILNMRRDINE